MKNIQLDIRRENLINWISSLEDAEIKIEKIRDLSSDWLVEYN